MVRYETRGCMSSGAADWRRFVGPNDPIHLASFSCKCPASRLGLLMCLRVAFGVRSVCATANRETLRSCFAAYNHVLPCSALFHPASLA